MKKKIAKSDLVNLQIKSDLVNLQITELPVMNEKLFKLEKTHASNNEPIKTIQDLKSERLTNEK